ncbi:ABC transporter ATP-binding protein [bacterium]|nr:ABC transporter ATP-binding protein [bacterium]MBU4511195.1 ABC transporter ATP-binding protein [bacterium]
MIEVKGLTKRYGELLAVDSISFNIKKGEIFGFLGPNGAGKTTTIKILTGELEPTDGDVKVAGFNPVSDRKNLHKIIGVVPEVQNLYERMTAKENLTFFAKLYDINHKRVDELLEQFDLQEWANEKVKNFSLGMKQRLLLARGLLPKPDILFLDEPTKGLDPYTARYIRSIIREVNKKGATIFLTTHYMEEADELSDRVVIIDKGKIIACDNPENLKRSQDKGTIKITLKDPMEERQFSLSDNQTGNRIKELLQSGRLLSMETEKATLEDVFINLTGKKLT